MSILLVKTCIASISRNRVYRTMQILYERNSIPHFPESLLQVGKQESQEDLGD